MFENILSLISSIFSSITFSCRKKNWNTLIQVLTPKRSVGLDSKWEERFFMLISFWTLFTRRFGESVSDVPSIKYSNYIIYLFQNFNFIYLAWSFTYTYPQVVIWWGFFRRTTPVISHVNILDFKITIRESLKVVHAATAKKITSIHMNDTAESED